MTGADREDVVPVIVPGIARVSEAKTWPGGSWSPRRLEVYCDGGHDRSGDPRHAEVFLATLSTRQGGPRDYERWFVVDGSPHGATQCLIHPDDVEEYERAPGLVELTGRVAERSQIRCPRCGLNLPGGERLSKGFNEVLEARRTADGFGGYTMHLEPTRGDRARSLLSQFADRAPGAPRLSLTLLVRILSV